MNNLSFDKYLDIANEEKDKRGLENYIPLYPMLRIFDNKLYVCVSLIEENDSVWEVNGNVKPKYWILIDIESNKIIEFNETTEKDFVIRNIIKKNVENKQKEISKYTIEKTLQYKNYLIEDIKNEKLPLQKKLASILGDTLEINGEMVNINEYLLSNLEEVIKTKIDDLVDVLIHSKYGSITFYYDNLFKKMVLNYINNKIIDVDKMKLCIEIMNNYYDGVIGIEYIFNVA